MMRRMIFASLMFLFPAITQAAVITESDTGFVFSQRNCQIQSVELIDVKLRPASFDYLHALVTWNYTCTRRNGRTIKVRDTRAVLFPTLDYDDAEKIWYLGDTAVAKRTSWHKAELVGDLFYTMWANIDDRTTLSFRVQIEQP